MNVYVTVYEERFGSGKVALASADVRIEHSPSEGYDNEKLRTLEATLTKVLRDGLRDALGKKVEP